MKKKAFVNEEVENEIKEKRLTKSLYSPEMYDQSSIERVYPQSYWHRDSSLNPKNKE